MRHIRAIGPCLLGFALVGIDAHAQGSGAECRPNPYLSRAKEEYDRLEFDRASRTLQRAVEHARNCRDDLADVYRLKGFVDAVNGERERCQRAFEILLALNPTYRMGLDVPPKIRSCFENAERVDPERRRLQLSHAPPGEVEPNSPVSIEVDVLDPLRLVDQMQVYFRRAGVTVYTPVSVRADDHVSLVIPALSVPSDPDGYEMEKFVRAIDRWEGVLSEVGGARDPLVFRVDKAKGKKPLYAKWWFWTTIGVVVGGGVVTGIAIANSSSDDVTLEIETTTGVAP